MDYETAKRTCHVRSAIYRKGDPVKVFTIEDLACMHPALQDLNADKVGKTVPKLYWKNHTVPLDDRIPDKDKLCNDWAEYDPREHEECSAFNEMPA